jgi:tetratricopeptide (TPR) repeat protein
MAPEQAAADPHIDHRADIYAVGAVAYELLTGRPPFMGTTPQMILSAHMTDSPEPVTKYREAVPPALEQLVLKCLEKKAADRWQSAEELLPQLEALATLSGGVTPTGTMPVGAARRGWKVATAAGTIAAILAVILVATLLPRGSGVTLDPERIVVAVFRNETGDPSLDQVGRQAGHWITQGLQQTGIVQVVPWETALQSSQYVQTEAEAGRVRDRVRALAEETGAGTVISGAYYQRGDTIQHQLEVTDASSGSLLTSLDPEAAPFDSPGQAIEPLRQQVMGFLAMYLDERIFTHASSVMQPPRFEAYREFDQGLAIYQWGWGDESAIPHFKRAFALDTTFVTPLIYAILRTLSIYQLAQADSLVGILERFRHRLSDYDRHWLDYMRARVDGDNPGALRAIRRAAELAPGSKAWYNRGYVALHVNRPQEAVDAFLSLDPQRGPMRGWQSYFTHLVWAYSDLGEYQNALDAAQHYREIYGDDPRTLGHEGVALAGLGRVEEVSALLDDLIALPEQGLNQGYYMTAIAVQLRRHGHIDAAHTTVDRAIQWYEAKPPETESSATWHNDYAVALYVADRWDEAHSVAKSLSEEFPEDLNYRGLVGIVAARRGDQAQALAISQWLETLDRPYLRGSHTAWRFQIAGALGDGERAVALWRQATAEGFRHQRPWYWRWIAFESLHDYPPFQELIRPKG